MEEINTPLPKVGHSQRCFARPKTLSLTSPLPLPPFQFTNPLRLPLYSTFWLQFLLACLSGSVKETSFQTLARWLLETLVYHLLHQPAFQIKVVFYASTSLLSDSLSVMLLAEQAWTYLVTKIQWNQMHKWRYVNINIRIQQPDYSKGRYATL